jgi:hypothetical protein
MKKGMIRRRGNENVFSDHMARNGGDVKEVEKYIEGNDRKKL